MKENNLLEQMAKIISEIQTNTLQNERLLCINH
jgi:hypothetical protein